jgi:hypothetical protein
MREMPYGQWVAFDGYESVHKCGNTSEYQSPNSGLGRNDNKSERVTSSRRSTPESPDHLYRVSPDERPLHLKPHETKSNGLGEWVKLIIICAVGYGVYKMFGVLGVIGLIIIAALLR